MKSQILEFLQKNRTNMSKTRILFIALAFLTTLSYAQKDKRLKGIEKQFNSILEISNAAGFAVAIVEGDKIIYAKGFGYKDYENKVPVDANTLFAIGSSTKAFTSALLGLHREDDKLSFNDSPRKHVPNFEFYNDELNNNVIIKDLMRHSTGIPRHDAAWYYFPSRDKDSLVMRMKHHEPFTGLRQQWYYNNFGFLLQGVITEKITGDSWEKNIEDKFFKPLGMDDSRTTIDGMKNSSNAALGYTNDADRNIKKTDYYDISGMSPAGSINSSVNDMSKWMIMWLNDGKYNDQQILPENYIREATSSQMVVSSGFPSKELPDAQFSNYGYGWFLHSYKGHYVAEHGGNIDGFSANVALYPTDSLGIVVLANQNGSAVPRLIRNITADHMLKVNKTEWAKKFEEEMAKAEEAQEKAKEEKALSNVKNTKPSHTKIEYTGTYSHPGYGAFEVVIKNDSLFTQLNGDSQYLNHFHYDTFEFLDIIDGKIDTTTIGNSIKITFSTNETGDIDNGRLKMEPTLDPIALKRQPNTIDVDAETLEQYVGKYDLMGTEIKAYIKDENVLYIFVPNQPEYALIPTAEHKFNFKTLEGFKIEFIETDGKINEVKFIQPNGIFVAKRKTEE